MPTHCGQEEKDKAEEKQKQQVCVCLSYAAKYPNVILLPAPLHLYRLARGEEKVTVTVEMTVTFFHLFIFQFAKRLFNNWVLLAWIAKSKPINGVLSHKLARFGNLAKHNREFSNSL